MRTKTTGPRRESTAVAKTPKTHKTPKTPKTPGTAETQQTPAVSAHKQPQEISEKDRRELKAWLDKTDRPFEVSTAPASKKRKRDPLPVEEDMFQERLNVQYDVKPRGSWESLRKYKRFTVGTESIATGECILVKHDENEEPKIDTIKQWKAKVLEVRALDPEHVYIRVAWLNRPEDLEVKKRKSYHGMYELIPTNQMDIIDAMAVNGALKVQHWDEEADDDDKSMPEQEQYFWRQTYDYANTKTFSELRKICIDESPQNPDELIVQCSDSKCRKWMHVRCIAKEAVKQAAKSAAIDYDEVANPTKKVGKPKSKSKRKSASNSEPRDSIGFDPSAVAAATDGEIVAEVLVKGLPDRPKTVPATEDAIIITYVSGKKVSESVCCLFCGSQID